MPLPVIHRTKPLPATIASVISISKSRHCRRTNAPPGGDSSQYCCAARLTESASRCAGCLSQRASQTPVCGGFFCCGGDAVGTRESWTLQARGTIVSSAWRVGNIFLLFNPRATDVPGSILYCKPGKLFSVPYCRVLRSNVDCVWPAAMCRDLFLPVLRVYISGSILCYSCHSADVLGWKQKNVFR